MVRDVLMRGMIISAMQRKLLCIICLFAFLLCGCKASPHTATIVNKKDGNFEEKKKISATSSYAPNACESIIYSENFSSTDKSVDFKIDINKKLNRYDMPVAEVVPHYLTESDAKRVATVLFGDVIGYEKQPFLAQRFSKDEIKAKLTRWSQFASSNALTSLYGQSNDAALATIKEFIEYYTCEYEIAPNYNINMPCQWEFKDEAYYTYAPEDVEKMGLLDNKAIMATYNKGDVAYSYAVVTRNKTDYKLNMISVHLFGGTSPMDIDERIFRAELCRTSAPTEEQIDSICSNAKKMLDEMELGEWDISQYKVINTFYGDTPEYTVHINATPTFHGVSAAQQPELYNLNNDTAYASNYYMTNATFDFSVDGTLIDFEMVSPIDIQDIINDNVATMDISALIDRAKTQLIHTDYHSYGIKNLERVANEELIYHVEITDLSLKLLRTRIPNTDDAYYYSPGIILEGFEECLGKESGNVYYASSEPRIYVAINAVDGTVVPLENNS